MNLHQLQNEWDDERARRRIDALRADIRPTVRADLLGLPLVFAAGALLAFAVAVVTP